VKRIFLLMAAMLVCNGAAQAGDLKVLVPVDEFRQMQGRLEALEKENNQLKQGPARQEVAVTPAPASAEMQNRLQAMESENARLRQEMNAAKVSQGNQAGSNPEIQAKLDALAKENSQLKAAARVGGAATTSSAPLEDKGLQASLEAAENENNHLRQEVKLLQAGALAEFFGSNKISAREQYFLERRKSINHVYKF